MPPHICSVAQKAYWNMLTQRQDQTIAPLGRSSSGKTTCCQMALEYLVDAAGSVDNRVTVEKIHAMFTILKSFGGVVTSECNNSTRFSMVMSLDFNSAGRITAGHLQTMLLERIRVAQQPEGESNFNVFSQLLTGADLDLRSELNLHQMADCHSFGMMPWVKPEEKQKASAGFEQLQSAMEVLGFTVNEQKAIWHVLAGIYHLGAAGACKVGRKQFMRFEWATKAASALGSDCEELSTAVFKHHLKQIIEQVTQGTRGGNQEEDAKSGPKMSGVECVEGMAAGLYEELFAAIVSLINRSLSSSLLTLASIMVVDIPGFHNPRHQKKERAATFEEMCNNYVQERLHCLSYKRTFSTPLERFNAENIEVPFEIPEDSPFKTVSVIDQTSSQINLQASNQMEEKKGLLWILDEEVLIQGSTDDNVINRLCSYYEIKGEDKQDHGPLRKCEQPLQFEIFHQLGQDPVRYDASNWINKAKLNLSAENAVQVLQQSKFDYVKDLFSPRAKFPVICRSVAGMEGKSQQAMQRVSCVRKTFASSFAAVKRRSVCAQIKLQMDALMNLLKRSQIHFVHCLVPRLGMDATECKGSQLCRGTAGDPINAAIDVPTVRIQLAGAQLLDAMRLCRIGYTDRMGLTEFRLRFQVMASQVMKKYMSTYEPVDERKAVEELFQLLDLEKKSIVMGRSQVFMKSGVLSRLEKQREKMISQNMILFQAACRGFLCRQKFKKTKIHMVALRCIQKNIRKYYCMRGWLWWQLLCYIRPSLSIHVDEATFREKEDEIIALSTKLSKSEKSRNELRQNVDLLESKENTSPLLYTGNTTPTLSRRRSSPVEEKLSRSSSALSEFLDEVRKKRASEKDPSSLVIEETSSLPIYRTTGASSLRRCARLDDDEEDFSVALSKLSDEKPMTSQGLTRSSSLRCLPSEKSDPTLSPAVKRMARFGSCESLNQPPHFKLASAESGVEGASSSLRSRPWRQCLETPLEEAGENEFGKQPLVFQNRSLSNVSDPGNDENFLNWKVPNLNFERKLTDDSEDILPALRRSQSTQSLSKNSRKDGQRPLSVHFGDLPSYEPSPSLGGLRSVLKKSSSIGEDLGNLSDSSSSSGSVVSCKSADSIKSRPRIQRVDGEGYSGKPITSEVPQENKRPEAEGKEDDVNSIMRKYLRKIEEEQGNLLSIIKLYSVYKL
ncbi:hypothetical protein GDO81_002076 [Engystomops pustulosus]|uniref:Myosin motor domain-containing protein n=1 Tax=Engystomops pustulosus TaxID=76066 RepID=A0AAV7DK06_ENGPU|nr:hypothetical protein GDO81_002076 [Engystomops pustulosus]